jgi:serine/threonine-protein kinase RsbW
VFFFKSSAMELQGEGDPGPFVMVVLDSKLDEARRFVDELEEHLLHSGSVSRRETFGIKLALEEAVINAIKHGNQMDGTKKVRVLYRLSTCRFEATISDEGDGFDPSEVPDPTAVENLERPCGRGLMLMRHYMSEVVYNAAGNCVAMSKELEAAENQSVDPCKFPTPRVNVPREARRRAA